MKSEGNMGLEKKKQIIESLHTIGANQPCARCGMYEFNIAGLHHLPLESTEGDFYIPCVLITCKNCGNITFHATRSERLL